MCLSAPILPPACGRPAPQQELMRLNVFKGAASLVNAEDFIGRCKVSLDELSEVRVHAHCKAGLHRLHMRLTT